MARPCSQPKEKASPGGFEVAEAEAEAGDPDEVEVQAATGKNRQSSTPADKSPRRISCSISVE